MINRPFCPQYGSNLTRAIGAAANVAISISPDSSTLHVYNSGAGDLYVRAYSSLAAVAVASAQDFPVPPGQTRLIFIGDVLDRASLFSIAGTTAQVMSGTGGV